MATLFITVNSFAFRKDTLNNGYIVKNHTDNPQYQKLQSALQKLYDIQQNGGWPEIIATQKYYLKGQTAPAIKQIKERCE